MPRRPRPSAPAPITARPTASGAPLTLLVQQLERLETDIAAQVGFDQTQLALVQAVLRAARDGGTIEPGVLARLQQPILPDRLTSPGKATVPPLTAAGAGAGGGGAASGRRKKPATIKLVVRDLLSDHKRHRLTEVLQRVRRRVGQDVRTPAVLSTLRAKPIRTEGQDDDQVWWIEKGEKWPKR